MKVKYFINEIEYAHLNNEQKKKITEKLERALGITPIDSKQQKKEMIG